MTTVEQAVAVRALTRPCPRPRWTAGMPGIGRLGLGIITFYIVIALAAPWLAPHDPTAYLGHPLERPGPVFLLGTNDVGQDLLSELIYGTRVSLVVGLAAASLVVVIATVYGALSGYLGGPADLALMRLLDVLLIIPRLPLMIVIAAYAGANLTTTILVIGLLSWPHAARVVRAQVLSLRSRAHVDAARLYGAGPLYVLRRHMVPALAPILAAAFVAQAVRAVLLEASLAFLGLGDPSLKSWGTSIQHALQVKGFFFGDQWLWWVVPIGVNLSLLLLGFTFLGIGLEVMANPRLRRSH